MPSMIYRGVRSYIEEVGKYQDGTKALEVSNSSVGAIARLTVCVEGCPPLEKDEYLIKTWSENEEITRLLLEQGMFTDTGKRVPTGYVEAQVWKSNF